MKNTKRAIALFTACALSTGILAGCGGNTASSATSGDAGSTAVSATSDTASSAAADGTKTEITVWHTWGAGPGLDKIVEAAELYNETNDKNIHVNIDFVANQSSGNTQTMDKLMAAIAAGNPPEVAMLDNFQIASWAAQDALTPLDDLMAGVDLNFDDVYDWATEGSIYQGTTYSIPYNGDARALFYNKDLFTAAGLDPENPPTTIDELNEAAEKLTIRDGSNYKQVGIVPWFKAGKPIYTWGWSFGGDFYDAETNTLTIDDPLNIEALQWEVDLANKMGGEDFVNYASGMGSDAEDPFITGQLAMVVRGQFDIANMAVYNPDLNYGITPIPSKEEGKNTTWCGGWGWTIPKGAKNAEASIDFMKFMMGEEAQKLLPETSSFSPVKTYNEAMYASDESMKVFMDLLPVAHIRPSVPVGQELWDGLNTALDSALHGEGQPAELLKALNEDMNAKMARLS